MRGNTVKLDKFLLNKSFQHYRNGIELIKDDFIDSNYERFLWRETLEELRSRKETSRLILSAGELETNSFVTQFLEQFKKHQDSCIFIFPESTSANCFMAKEIIRRNHGELFVLKNLIPDDDTINYVGILDSSAKKDLPLLFHVVFSSNVYGNFGGYKMYGYDLAYYANLCANENLIYSIEYSKDNLSVFYYNGFETRKDTNPYTIYNVRKNIEQLTALNFFNSEFELYRNLTLCIMPNLHSFYNKAKESVAAIDTNWKEEKSILYSQLVDRGIINTKWKSEASLFKAVIKQFPDAVFQYKPQWLSPQSLDIYIPEKRIGIEYQGIQHYKTIAFFGGEKAFEHRKELDEKKRKLCKENSIKLIEWNYNIEITANNVKKLIDQ